MIVTDDAKVQSPSLRSMTQLCTLPTCEALASENHVGTYGL